MAVDPTRTPSQHSSEYTAEHHLNPTVTKLRLVWPTEERSGPYVPDIEGTPHQLWAYIKTNPQWPWNIRIMDDGLVEQRPGMTQDDINEAKYVLWGGHVYEVEEGSELHVLLVAAGYTFTEIEA